MFAHTCKCMFTVCECEGGVSGWLDAPVLEVSPQVDNK